MNKVFIKKLDEIEINNYLPIGIKHYLERFKNKHLIESSKAYSYLFKILKEEYNLDIENEEFILNEFDKPYLKVNNNIYFNISHSYEMVAIVISDKECGIDIELVDKTKDIKFIHKVFNEEEINYINNDIDKAIKLWTIKESYYKCVGIGIDLAIIKNDINYENVKTKELFIGLNKYYVSVDA